ncbi:unnamed protein product [Pleuronectes platessa]|uniref:Uncharacterized protein n=1 Tax=Pleuronectes platessa TaxID=8262 RepID=A0A9N7TW31_PLEPL|nr:unnamed protein product [Pleuronectes platessa]
MKLGALQLIVFLIISAAGASSLGILILVVLCCKTSPCCQRGNHCAASRPFHLKSGTLCLSEGPHLTGPSERGPIPVCIHLQLSTEQCGIQVDTCSRICKGSRSDPCKN